MVSRQSRGQRARGQGQAGRPCQHGEVRDGAETASTPCHWPLYGEVKVHRWVERSEFTGGWRGQSSQVGGEASFNSDGKYKMTTKYMEFGKSVVIYFVFSVTRVFSMTA